MPRAAPPSAHLLVAYEVYYMDEQGNIWRVGGDPNNPISSAVTSGPFNLGQLAGGS